MPIDSTIPVSSDCYAEHPICTAIRLLRSIMRSMSLIEIQSPCIDLSNNNFDELNIPKDHPARGSHDTFYMDAYGHTLLRTHTTVTNIHALQSGKYSLPFGVFSMGRVYRRDHDSTHSPMFYNCDVMVSTKTIGLGHLKWIIKKVLCNFFENINIKTRLRSSYFPFTSPSFEVDISRDDGKTWIEVLGAGMMRKNIMQNNNINENAIAFGLGIDRLAMIKYEFSNINDMYNNEYQFLRSWQNYARSKL